MQSHKRGWIYRDYLVLAVDPFNKAETLHAETVKRTVKGEDDVFVIYPLIIDVIPKYNISIRDAWNCFPLKSLVQITQLLYFNSSTSNLDKVVFVISETKQYLLFFYKIISIETERRSLHTMLSNFDQSSISILHRTHLRVQEHKYLVYCVKILLQTSNKSSQRINRIPLINFIIWVSSP